MNSSTRTLIACLVAAPLLGGCASMMTRTSTPSDPSAGDKRLVHGAVTAERWADVKRYCSSRFKKADATALHQEARVIACERSRAHEVAMANMALVNPKCSEITRLWETHKVTVLRPRGALKTIFPAMAVKIAACGKIDYVFQEMIHWGPHTVGAIGRKALEAMDEAGINVESAYLKWLGAQSSAPYDHKLGGYALEHYLHWRLHKGGEIDCKPYVKAWSMFDGGDEMAWIYVFYRATKCTAAADWVAKGLVHSFAQTRHRACKTLGSIGNENHIRQMANLAKSDATFKVVRYKRVYWVRDMCRQAVGQIQMR